MNCKKCGNIVTPFDKFCQNCGEPNENYNGGNTQTVQTETPVVPVQEPVVNTQAQKPVTPVQEPVTPVQEPASNVPVQNSINSMPTQPVINSASNIEKKKSNAGFIILIIVMSLIIIGLGTFIAIKYIGNNDTKDTNINNNSANNNSNNNGNEVINEPTNVTNDSVIDVDGYTFVKPSDLQYNEEKNMYGNSNIIFNLKVVTESFDVALGEKEQLLTVVQSYIPQATYSENTYGSRKYMNYSGVVSNINAEVFITSIDDETCVMGLLLINPNYTKTEAYTYLNKIFDSAKESTTSTFAKKDIKGQIGAFDVSNLPSFE